MYVMKYILVFQHLNGFDFKPNQNGIIVTHKYDFHTKCYPTSNWQKYKTLSFNI